MDRGLTLAQIILTDHVQNMHGSLGINMNTWHDNNKSQGLSEITKSLKTAITTSLLCMQFIATSSITKIHSKILWKGNMAYYQRHI